MHRESTLDLYYDILAPDIAALLHDIGSPVFRHTIDYMNGDASTQESTEEYTADIIRTSWELALLLKDDGIKLKDVIDYKDYPIADNERPRLSADRLDSVFMAPLVWLANNRSKRNKIKPITLRQIKKIYQAITIVKNEDNIDEMAFNDLVMARQCLTEANDVARECQTYEDRMAMSLLGEITQKVLTKMAVHDEILYRWTDGEAVQQIISATNRDNQINKWWYLFKNMERWWILGTNDDAPRGSFEIDNRDLDVKLRTIDPLVMVEGQAKRLLAIDELSVFETEKVLKRIENGTKKYKTIYVEDPKVLIRK